MRTRIIGLASQKQAGKTTAAQYIRDYLDDVLELKDNCIYSFADTLKDFCIKTLGLRYEQCYGSEEEKNSWTIYKWDYVNSYFREKYSDQEVNGVKVWRRGRMTAREVMQVQGEMQRKFFNIDIWVNATFKKIETDNHKIAIIDDVRHLNEVLRCIENGYVIHLKKITNNDAADSEAELTKIDWNSYPNIFEIDNTLLTIEQKNDKIKEILSKII